MAYIRMDLQYFAQEKTEKATPQKRKESRRKGQVAKSADVNTAFILLFVFLFLLFAGGFLRDSLFSILQISFKENALMEVTPETVQTVMTELALLAVKVVAPIFAVSLAAAIFSNYVQVGFLFSTEPLVMKLERINPLKGAKRIFSVRALVELLKSILKIAFVGLCTFSILWLSKEDVFRLADTSPGESFQLIGSLTVQMGIFTAVLLLFLSIFDYVYQKYDFEKNIRMSKQDVKDEHKKLEGDPLIKSKMKERQRQMAMQRMMQEVPKADVVITNPTHYAVALKYEEDEMDAPQVTAKGVDYVALKIIAAAKHHEVTTVENRPLARALYEQTEIGDTVPEELFKAVAEVLAYVYRLQRKI